ncbi:hypothetical protein E2542_SST25087 [Spatholobus suberectus]|nr:hypothetical protein E2542_SST25087 [Spatholobus suberectus]
MNRSMFGVYKHDNSRRNFKLGSHTPTSLRENISDSFLTNLHPVKLEPPSSPEFDFGSFISDSSFFTFLEGYDLVADMEFVDHSFSPKALKSTEPSPTPQRKLRNAILLNRKRKQRNRNMMRQGVIGELGEGLGASLLLKSVIQQGKGQGFGLALLTVN